MFDWCVEEVNDMVSIDLLIIVIGAYYGYSRPGKEDRMNIIKKGLRYGVIIGLVFALLGLLTGGIGVAVGMATVGVIGFVIMALVISIEFIIRAKTCIQPRCLII